MKVADKPHDEDERIRVEEALRKSEALFRSVSTSLPIGIFRTNAEGLCDYVNRASETISGLSFEQSLGEGWLNAAHPDDRNYVATQWHAAMASGRDFDQVYRVVRRDGGERTVHARAVRIDEPSTGECGWVGTLEDVTESHRAADALRAGEARLQRVLEGSNDGFWDWDVSTGRVDASDSLAAMLGFTPEELRPHVNDWERHIHRDDIDRVRREISDHLEGRSDKIEVEFRLRSRAGKWKWLLDRGKVLARDSAGHALWVSGTLTDISMRKRAESELNQFFNLSVDMLGIIGFDGVFRRVNPAFTKVLGYTAKELTTTPVFDFIDPADRPVAEAIIARLRQGIAVENRQIRYICSDGTMKWISWSSSPVLEEQLIYAIGRDVTFAKSTEEALRQSEARTRSIIDNSLGGVITTDKNGIIDSVNPATESMFGYHRTELIGQSVTMLVGEPGTRGEILSRLRKVALGRVTEVMGRRRNGELFPCELSLFEFSSGAGKYFAGHMLDISERHAVERMKSDFVATVSHELRTPLTSIRGSLGLLAAGVMGPLPEDAADMVAVAERSSVRLIALINDILDLEKLQRGKMGMKFLPVSIRAFILRAVESVSALAAAEKVTIEVTGDDALVLADEDRLTQVILNLLSNAVRHSAAGSVVTVDAQGDGCNVLIRVVDHGSGISREAQPRLFHRFQQIDNSDSRRKGGTGLGLAICKAIVEQHGGMIGVQSEAGVGSTFWLRLPMAQPFTGLYTRSPVVLVLDAQGTLDSVVRNLIDRPVTLLHATSVDDAARILTSLCVRVAILDSSTAGTRLSEVLQHIRSAPREIAVLLTGREIALKPHQLSATLTVVEQDDEASLIRALQRLAVNDDNDVLIVGNGALASAALPSLAAGHRIHVREARTAAEAESALASSNPIAIVLDAGLSEQERAALIRELQHNPEYSSTPVLLHWSDAGAPARSSVVRVGAARFMLDSGVELRALLDQLLEMPEGVRADEDPGD